MSSDRFRDLGPFVEPQGRYSSQQRQHLQQGEKKILRAEEQFAHSNSDHASGSGTIKSTQSSISGSTLGYSPQQQRQQLQQGRLLEPPSSHHQQRERTSPGSYRSSYNRHPSPPSSGHLQERRDSHSFRPGSASNPHPHSHSQLYPQEHLSSANSKTYSSSPSGHASARNESNYQQEIKQRTSYQDQQQQHPSLLPFQKPQGTVQQNLQNPQHQNPQQQPRRSPLAISSLLASSVKTEPSSIKMNGNVGENGNGNGVGGGVAGMNGSSNASGSTGIRSSVRRSRSPLTPRSIHQSQNGFNLSSSLASGPNPSVTGSSFVTHDRPGPHAHSGRWEEVALDPTLRPGESSSTRSRGHTPGGMGMGMGGNLDPGSGAGRFEESSERRDGMMGSSPRIANVDQARQLHQQQQQQYLGHQYPQNGPMDHNRQQPYLPSISQLHTGHVSQQGMSISSSSRQPGQGEYDDRFKGFGSGQDQQQNLQPSQGMHTHQQQQQQQQQQQGQQRLIPDSYRDGTNPRNLPEILRTASSRPHTPSRSSQPHSPLQSYHPYDQSGVPSNLTANGAGGQSTNAPIYMDQMVRGQQRFTSGPEQSAYRAGFEDGWEQRSRMVEGERSRRVSLNISTAPPTSSLRTTDNHPAHSPAREETQDLPVSRPTGDYVGYDGWERDGRAYDRSDAWAAGQNRLYSHPVPGSSSSRPEDYPSPYLSINTPTPNHPPYNSHYRSDHSPAGTMNSQKENQNRQDRSSEGITSSGKPRKGRAGERQAISCNMCRQRKSKCDGNPPYPCGPCTKKGTESQCQYAQYVRRRGPAKKKEQGSNEGSHSPTGNDSYSQDNTSPSSRRASKSLSSRRFDEQGGRDDLKRTRLD